MKTFGLALAGGGARGAYAAGVLRYIFTEVQNDLGYTPWPSLIGGTSVGALNGYFAACQSMSEIHRMTEIWTTMNVEDIYLVPFKSAFGVLRGIYRSTQRAAILDPTPLYELIKREASRRALRHSIAQGKCKAFVVSATQLHTGKNILFLDTSDPTFTIPPPPQGSVIRTSLYPEHLLASTAIPLVFPPVRIDGNLYVDGGLRQNAPLHPVMYGGATRILVIGTRTIKEMQTNKVAPASLGLVAGKTLNALTLDPVERDSLAAERFNRLIEWGVSKFGEKFADDLEKDTGLRATSILHIRPSIDLGKLAAEVFDPKKVSGSWGTQWLLNKLYEQSQESGESDLLSHLLFDKCYTKEAEALGFEDAKKQHQEILEFLY
jgi:NTE family protein